MNKKGRWKVITVVALVLGSILYVLPSFFPGVFPDSWKKLNYGLDLKGGLELRYTVDYKRAIGDNVWKVSGLFRDRAIALHFGKLDDLEAVKAEDMKTYREKITVERVDWKSVKLTFPDDMKDLAGKIDDDFLQNIDRAFTRASGSGNTVTVMLKYEEGERLKKDIINQTMDIIRKRIDAFGLVEPDVRRAGDADIDVQLPGVEKTKMQLVRAMIGQTAQLNFRLLEKKGNPFEGIAADLADYKKINEGKTITITVEDDSFPGQQYLKADKKSELLAFVRFVSEKRQKAAIEAKTEAKPMVDDDHMIGYEEISETNKVTQKEEIKGFRTRYVVRNMKVGGAGKERVVSIGGERLTRAMVAYDTNGAPYVSIDFDGQGAKDFGDLTTEQTGEYLAIMLDDEVKSAPRIQEPITGGRCRVTLGSGTGTDRVREAQGLVTVLTHGAYKAPVHKVHDHTVGPSLGAASINQGMVALGAGALLVILFMTTYYRWCGAVACVALLVNVFWILAVLVSFNAALTLPGLAGIVLTLGIGVDANVLIFERTREELRHGKSVRAALDAGYSKAFWTIFDSHVTQAIAGFILLEFTTGPVYGFAVTLLIGIASSLFTAIVITRMIFNYVLSKKNLQELSI